MNIKEIIPIIVDNIHNYYGNMLFLTMAVFSYLYLYSHNKELRNRLFYPVVLLVLCIVNPILYYFVFSKIVYWRLFWMLPNLFVIAYAITKIVQECGGRIVKGGIIIVFTVMIIMNGMNVYKKGAFIKAQNWQKLSNDTVEICNLILQLDDTPRCVMPIDLFSEVRQYSGEIEMMYGRNALGYISDYSDQQIWAMYSLEDKNTDMNYVFQQAKKYGYSIIVAKQSNLPDREVLNRSGYSQCAKITDYIIYVNKDISNHSKKSWYVSKEGYIEEGMMSLYTITDENNNVIVIDGGYAWTEWFIKGLLSNSYNNHISAWIITNPNIEHIGALHSLILNSTDLTIDKLITTNFNKETDKDGTFNGILQDLSDNVSEIQFVKEDDTFSLLGLRFEVLNAQSEEGDNSLCFLVSGEKEKMLYCSDIDATVENRLIEKYGERLNADFLQVANHGENNLNKEFFNLVSPRVAFIDTTVEKFHNINNAVSLNKNYLKELGSTVYCINPVPNKLVLK